MMVNRFDIINKVIEITGAKKYLEIGVQSGICFQNVKCEYKVWVDPHPNFKDGITLLTSDEFFDKNEELFDVVFIDWLHVYEQVTRDLLWALVHTSENGVIILHDMNPTTEERARSFIHGWQWNGDCYKLAMNMKETGADFITINEDQGCLVLQKKKQKKNWFMSLWNPEHKYSYKYFDENRQEILNLQPFEELWNYLS